MPPPPPLSPLSVKPPPCGVRKLTIQFRTLTSIAAASATAAATASAAASSPSLSHPSSALLLRLCTILYQQQNSPLAKLHSHLAPLALAPSPVLFLDVCNRFPLSWKPVHHFHLYLLDTHNFSHTSTTLSKLLHVLGNSRNIPLLFDTLTALSHRSLITPTVLRTAARSLAQAQEFTKCAAIFHLIPSFHDTTTLNFIIQSLCHRRLVDAANAVVSMLRSSIAPDATTYRLLTVGFCRAGDMEAACKIWNRTVSSGLEPEVEAYEEFVATMFKNNRVEDAMMLFKLMRKRRFSEMRIESYGLVIGWMSKRGRIRDAYMMLAEMLKRGVGVDGETLGALVYASVVRRKVREGYRVTVEGVDREPDVAMYHGLMKGLLRLRRAREATGVLREMIARGCEPNMHTYIMLLQGHMGKKGRKGRDPVVNFESIFVGGLVKVGRTVEAVNYMGRSGRERQRFDYNRFLHYFSNEEGVVMFEEVGRRLREVGLVDLGDIFLIYGERMATRDRRTKARLDCSVRPLESDSQLRS